MKKLPPETLPHWGVSSDDTVPAPAASTDLPALELPALALAHGQEGGDPPEPPPDPPPGG